MTDQERTLGPQRTRKNETTEATGDASTSPASEVKGNQAEHKLGRKWTLHYDSGMTKQQKWGDSIHEIADIETVEEFWRLYNNLIRPGDLKPNAAFNLFKAGVKPMYEDPENSQGGYWSLQFARDAKSDVVNKYWLFTLLTMIGELYEDPDEICGALIQRKKYGQRIQLWTKTCHDKEVCERNGQKLADNLEGRTMRLSFFKHNTKEELFKIA